MMCGRQLSPYLTPLTTLGPRLGSDAQAGVSRGAGAQLAHRHEDRCVHAHTLLRYCPYQDRSCALVRVIHSPHFVLGAAIPADGEQSYVADKLAVSAVESRPLTLHGFPRIGFGIPHQPNNRCRCFGCFNATQVNEGRGGDQMQGRGQVRFCHFRISLAQSQP